VAHIKNISIPREDCQGINSEKPERQHLTEHLLVCANKNKICSIQQNWPLSCKWSSV